MRQLLSQQCCGPSLKAQTCSLFNSVPGNMVEKGVLGQQDLLRQSNSRNTLASLSPRSLSACSFCAGLSGHIRKLPHGPLVATVCTHKTPMMETTVNRDFFKICYLLKLYRLIKEK